ncbi:hypothetical protein IKF81_02300 [Candidatus Saccharibacteria bacterium]|nr:hypothetical protein [Candidatus Saccharibacteria bacterium]
MEEKIYFKPKEGIKKHKSKKEHKWLNLTIVCILLLAIIIIIFYLLRGKNTISGQYPENIRNESLSCEKEKSDYEKANLKEIENSDIKINIIFNDKKAVKSISLIYTAIFPTEKDAYATEAVSHAFFNKSLEASGYSASKFSNKYARYDNKLILSLTANGNEIDSFSAPFFMIKTNEGDEVNMNNLESYRSMYESQGFTCHDSLEQ